MRDDEWLINRFYLIWNKHFSDIEKKNHVLVRFKGRWKNKFGHIKRLKDGNTEIVLNGLLKHEEIPDYIIDVTLAHEIVHYSHGFNSPLPKLYRYPHYGGIVRKELKNRGFNLELRMERNFIKEKWQAIHDSLNPKPHKLFTI